MFEVYMEAWISLDFYVYIYTYIHTQFHVSHTVNHTHGIVTCYTTLTHTDQPTPD